ncbi:PHP domain protein [Catenulispora acidiphila DSM 44928]|uniref:Histidinol-phosphatase n=1 Tax=Catenulispora acidiphila (strain DSM 44928 / JCM 14897 / NBRC 102108 / NRRL B-24433 / ID139908) TaxID=479433 RepID=C7QIS8_CATAD|nr:PHP domain-containing protein [Catenulispora acidiphila]ACU76978.1 PHP domain protein [Catenulispora acidiphila DSM 44928]
MLPPDNHVHSEYSWDALAGSMERTCERAVEIGLPSIAFTEHADFSISEMTPESFFPDQWKPYVELVDGRSILTPPRIDLTGYLETLERCRDRFPTLRVLSGVELSEAHWFPEETADLLKRGGFQRILASLHTASARDEDYADIGVSIKRADPSAQYRGYLAEAVRLIEEYDGFEVLTHIDYPVRYWPHEKTPFDLLAFEDDIRLVLRTLARADKLMEFNTRIPLDPRVVGWWRQEGGKGVSFASDAHVPDAVGRGFQEAAEVARAAGFKPGADLFDFWVRD